MLSILKSNIRTKNQRHSEVTNITILKKEKWYPTENPRSRLLWNFNISHYNLYIEMISGTCQHLSLVYKCGTDSSYSWWVRHILIHQIKSQMTLGLKNTFLMTVCFNISFLFWWLIEQKKTYILRKDSKS